eukprot:SAG31_NODE_20747_length_566_cov_0.877944_1_plen_138_part_10
MMRQSSAAVVACLCFVVRLVNAQTCFSPTSADAMAIADIVVAAHIETTMLTEELDHMENAICNSLSGSDPSTLPSFCAGFLHPALTTGVVLTPGAEFASTLGSTTSLADCFLTPDEIEADAADFPDAVEYINNARSQL